VPWLSDRKWAFIRLEGKSFGDVPLNMELKLEVHDSPNSAGIVIDALRFCKLALDHKISGSLFGPSSWLMKSPPEQYHDDVAHRLAEEFIARPVGGPGRPAPKRRNAAASKRKAASASTAKAPVAAGTAKAKTAVSPPASRAKVRATATKAKFVAAAAQPEAAHANGNGKSEGAAALAAKTIAAPAPKKAATANATSRVMVRRAKAAKS
jgi:hypothetical protein